MPVIRCWAAVWPTASIKALLTPLSAAGTTTPMQRHKRLLEAAILTWSNRTAPARAFSLDTLTRCVPTAVGPALQPVTVTRSTLIHSYRASGEALEILFKEIRLTGAITMYSVHRLPEAPRTKSPGKLLTRRLAEAS